MRCPFCKTTENKVIDSRLAENSTAIRRRRECEQCGKRFTTYERIEEIVPLVVKKDGRREAFDRKKLLAGIQKAVEKRPVTATQIDETVSKIEQRLIVQGDREISSTSLGEQVCSELSGLDDVAYVRFASVYRDFRDVHEFMEELKSLLNLQGSPRTRKNNKRQQEANAVENNGTSEHGDHGGDND